MNTENNNHADVQIFGPSFSNFVRSVMLICEEYDISYQVGLELDGQTIEFKSDEHLALHPYGKLPVLKHNALLLPETASICRYLLASFAPEYLNSLSTSQNAKIDAFSAIVSIYIDKAIVRDYLLEFAFPKGENGEVRMDAVKSAQPAVVEALRVLDKELQQGETLDGQQFSVADALVAPMLHYLSVMTKDFNLLQEFPALESYLSRLMARPSCKKVLVAMQ